MRYLKTTLSCAILLSTSIVGIAACGDDDNAGPNPTNEAGADQITPIPNNPIDGGNDAPSIDGGCKFNDFVLNLINTQTNFTSAPSTDLGDNCTDDQTPFPAATFN
jgi:hypothetical protein